MRTILIAACLLLVAVQCLKPSQAGVNDWHLINIGEVRDLAFNKNKIHFLSQLNSIGVIDKHTGRIEARAVAGDSERVVRWGELEMSLVTRYNQIITYFVRQSGVDKSVDNRFMNEQQRIESVAKHGSNEYFLSNSSLLHGKQKVRSAKEGERFLKLAVSQTGVAFLLSKVAPNTLCLQRYEQDVFTNKFCREELAEQTEIQIHQNHVFVLFPSSTLILAQNLQLVKEVKQKLIEVVNSVAILQNQNYNFIAQEEVVKRPLRSRTNNKIQVHETQNKLTFYKDDIEVFHLPKTGKVNILRAWINLKSEMEYDLVVQYKDLELVSYSISRANVQTSWQKEESLAYIEDIVFMKYSQMDTLDNEYHRNLISHTYRGLNIIQKLLRVPNDIVLRLKEQVSDITRWIHSSLYYVVDSLASIETKKLQKFEMSKEQEIKLGLRKYIIAVTKQHTIVAIDTKTKQILWKTNHVDIANNIFVGLVQLKRDYETEITVLVTYSKDTATIYIQQITEKGQINLLQSYASPQTPSIYKLNAHSLAIKINDKITKYGLFKQDDLVEKQYYFYTSQQHEISGWKVIGDTVVKIWNFQTLGDEKIIKVASAFRGDQRAHIPLFDREKVFFKNVDFTNIAVMTSRNHTNIALYIVNGRTGKVQFNSIKNHVNTALPINLIYDQNNVLASYFNARQKMFQIWTIEQYHERIETSAVNMISDYLNGVEIKPQQNQQNTIFENQIYASTVTIKEMYVSESKMSLTRRNIFVITREDKLYTINRDFVSTRRPKKESKSFFSNQKFPEYNYLLPFSSTAYLSYDITLHNISNLRFGPTDMESSIFVFCFGMDNFLIRTAPDKTFDMITEDFNHVILILILVVATVVILVGKRYVTLAKLKRPHLD